MRSFLIKNDSEGNLIDFEGLGNIEKMDNFFLIDLCCIQDFSGLSSLDTVTNEVKIHNCSEITSLEGSGAMFLEGGISLKENPLLTSIEETTYGERYVLVEVVNNPSLTEFGGLSDVTWATHCEVSGQNDISFLSNLRLAANLHIQGNESVTDISVLQNFEGCNNLHLKDLKDLNDLDDVADIYLWSSFCLLYTSPSPRD